MKNTDGERDAVLTMAFVGFVIVMVKVLLAGASVTIASTTISAGNVDPLTVATVLTPTLGAYVARRYTDAKFDPAAAIAAVANAGRGQSAVQPAPTTDEGRLDPPVR
jgi:hypothetical protein